MSGNLAPSPTESMMQIINGMCISRCVSVVAEMSIADLLVDGPRDAATLAEATKSDCGALYRVLRMLSGVGIFVELTDRQFRNTPLSETLRSNTPGSVRSYAKFFGCPLHWQFWGDLDYSVRTGKPSSTKDHPGLSPFEILAQNPVDQEIFNDAMTTVSALDGAAIVETYDFARFRRIVDVGGGHGELALMIARAAPESLVTVYDLPHVVEGTTKRIAREGQADRVAAVGGSFLDNVPSPADLCVLMHVVHDWYDASAQRILRNCRGALGEGGRILVCEMVIGHRPESIPALILDIEMLAGAGGRERTEAEFAELFRSAGFRLERVVETRSPIRLLEGIPC